MIDRVRTVRPLPLVLAVALITATFVHAGAPDPSWLNDELVVRGDYFRAMTVAYDDFSKQLTESTKGPNKEFSDHMSRIENYNFKVAAGPARYVVWISPRMSDDYPVIFGGQGTYILDAQTFKVLEKHFPK
jgi:hypothetical protein